MAANLKLVELTSATEKQRVGRKTDADYGRDGHRYLTPEQVAALVKPRAPTGMGCVTHS
jgi:hypothetical protein